MSLWKIAWRNIQHRGLASLLTTLSMAFGVMLIVAVLLIEGIISESFRSNTSLGYNMIVGAEKGGGLQLVLNTVYHLSKPVGNIPYSYYQEFLPAAERGDGRDGTFAMFTELAIPVCLGDYFKTYRVVGTTPRMFDNFVYDFDRNRKYEFAKGRNFQTHSTEYGYFEAVVGATVAREAMVKLGDAITPTHGPEGEAHDVFHVVGILAPSGTPNDRAVFVNMEGFYLLEGHAKPLEEQQDSADTVAEGAVEGGPVTGQLSRGSTRPDNLPRADGASGNVVAADKRNGLRRSPRESGDRRLRKPLPIAQRDVTAVLLRTAHRAVAPGLRKVINDGQVAQAVSPISEIYGLFSNIVTPIKMVLLLLTAMICVVSGISILVSIYNSMSERRHDIAVMRALGAGRPTVMTVILLESVLLSLAGGLIGWAAGHVLIGTIASPFIEARTGVVIGTFDFAPPITLAMMGGTSTLGIELSSELLLIPCLIVLAIIVGLLPALVAYRTDVARTLSATP